MGLTRFTSLLFFLSAMCAAKAQADPNWQLHGTTSNERCFYDSAGVQRRPDSLVRTWVKCLSQSEMDGIDIKQDYTGKIFNQAAEKVTRGYVPPLAIVAHYSSDDAIFIIAAEQIADISFLEPTARIFYELNCQERMLRELSISTRNGNASNKARSWSYAAPETNGDRLLKLLCH
jgi:hypothetical protein